MIVDLWVTTRGFAYASAWMEKCEPDSKTTTKALENNYISFSNIKSVTQVRTEPS